MQDWQDEVQISEECISYCAVFIGMRTKFGSMWDVHLGRLSIAIHQIKLFDESTYAQDNRVYINALGIMPPTYSTISFIVLHII